MTTELHQIQIHLPGILKVLGEHLYSNPEVAIREMLQNAHDACNRRLIEDHKTSEDEIRIDIMINPNEEKVHINDNGSGLTKKEIQTFLATIGKGYTAEVRKSLEEFDRKKAIKFIGQFGLGLLSGFLIAKKIEIRTRSFSADEGFRYTSSGGSSYSLEPIQREDIGTECILHLKEEFSYLADVNIIGNTLRHYGFFLPIPIYLNQNPTPINSQAAPWKSKNASDSDYIEFIKSWFGITALSVIPLKNVVEGENEISIEGLLFIPEYSTVSINEFGELVIYIRNMFICSNEKNLLPTWAKFIGGVIDCPLLSPTASRESVRKDKIFDIVQKALEVQILDFFRATSDSSSETIKSIVENHNDLIKGWAIYNEPFFREIKDLVTFSTNQGRMNLPDYLKLSKNRIFYHREDLSNLQIGLLFNSLNVAVIDARWFGDESFLKTYVDYDLEVIKMFSCEEAVPKLLEKYEKKDGESGASKTKAYYEKKNLQVRLVKLPNSKQPLYYLCPKELRVHKELKQKIQTGDIPTPMKGLIDDEISNSSQPTDMLFVNTKSSLIQKLESIKEPSRRENLLNLLFQFTVLVSGNSTAKTSDTYEAFVNNLDALI